MRIVVVGAGALGSVLAAHLARAGADVSLLARGERARNIARDGLRVTGLSDFSAEVRVVEEPHEISDADLLVVCVKTYDTAAVLRSLTHLKPGSVLSLQNGILKDDQLVETFGELAPLGAAADFSAELMKDGEVRFTRNEGLYIGELPQGISDRVERIASVIASSGVKCLPVTDIRSAEWSKFVAWISLAPAAVLSRLETHRILCDPSLAGIHVALARETGAVASALGVQLQDLVAIAPALRLTQDDLATALATAQTNGRMMESRGITTHKLSTLQDLESGKRLEIEETLGFIVQQARDLGIAVPTVETCYRLLAGIERTRPAASSSHPQSIQ